MRGKKGIAGNAGLNSPSGFVPAYGGYRQGGVAAHNSTVVASNSTPVNLSVGTLTEKALATGIGLVAGGGLKNNTGETGIFKHTTTFNSAWCNDSGASFDFGVRVREVDEVTYKALVIGDTGIYFNGANPMPNSVITFVSLAQNEVAFAGVQKLNGSPLTITHLQSVTMERIA